jgi:hypothetical protein
MQESHSSIQLRRIEIRYKGGSIEAEPSATNHQPWKSVWFQRYQALVSEDVEY